MLNLSSLARMSHQAWRQPLCFMSGFNNMNLMIIEGLEEGLENRLCFTELICLRIREQMFRCVRGTGRSTAWRSCEWDGEWKCEGEDEGCISWHSGFDGFKGDAEEVAVLLEERVKDKRWRMLWQIWCISHLWATPHSLELMSLVSKSGQTSWFGKTVTKAERFQFDSFLISSNFFFSLFFGEFGLKCLGLVMHSWGMSLVDLLNANTAVKWLNHWNLYVW